MTRSSELAVTASGETLLWSERASPLGTLEIWTRTDGALLALAFPEHAREAARRIEARQPQAVIRRAELPDQVSAALDAYFAGEARALETLAVAPEGSAFEQAVWAALRRIPAGTTCSYAALAADIGRPPGAARAVGMANARNPIAIVVPCHRVIAANGALWGYAGGLWRKQWLLEHERVLLGLSLGRREPLSASGPLTART